MASVQAPRLTRVSADFGSSKWNHNFFLKPLNHSKYQKFTLQCAINAKEYVCITELEAKERAPLTLQSPSTRPPLPLNKNSTNLVKIFHFYDKNSIFSTKCSPELESKERGLFTFAIAGTMLGLLLNYPSLALAATGGRMGGRSSSSSSSRSSSFSSSSSLPLRSSSLVSPSSDSPSSTNVSYYTSTSYAPTPQLGVRSSVGESWDTMCFWFILGVITSVTISSLFGDHESGRLGQKTTSVIKLQVCLLGMARSLQKDLNEIAEVADTSTSEGLNFILKETVLALLRHPDCCISTYSSVDVKQSTDDGEKHFDQLSIEERGKLGEETLVNVNTIKRKKSTQTQEDSGSRNEFIVITILVAVEGAQNLPIINNTTDLKEALQKLGSISSSKITAVEVLWTPQEENDTLSEQDLLENYPLLRSLQDGIPYLTADYTNSRVQG